jgi:cell division protein FtsZ
LAQSVDSLITIPNNNLLSVLGKDVKLLDAFKAANNVLLGAVQGIAELITRPGLINVDFADVRTVMSEMGMAMMGTGVSTGANRAEEAARVAISSPLLDDMELSGARGVLVNITAGMNMSIGEFEAVGKIIRESATDNATVVVGTVIDPEMTDDLRVTVVVTGLGGGPAIPRYLQESAQATLQQQAQQQQQVELKEKKSDGTLDYHQLERPAVMRKQAAQKTVPVIDTHDMDYLDIPAFLRRQDDENKS